MTATEAVAEGLGVGGGRAPIRVLPPEVAARIAAGEVIERPAAVVKELIENALDAGATRIAVAVEAGGIERIRVRDDGCGIPPAQLADAFERHATSKLRSAEALFAVRSLGFRGEALAAIVAAAAELDCTTRVAGEGAAAAARFRGGRAAPGGSAAGAPGTSIEVRGLFAGLPARRAFLRSPRAEARAVARVLGDYALAYPAVAFRLEADGRVALAAPGSQGGRGGDTRAAWAAVYDAASAGQLIALEHREPVEGGVLRVTGLLGPPALQRGNRSALHLVANGRAIADRALLFAIERAYEGLLPAGRHPLGLVRIELPPALLDVNVHPTKAEVRFRDERAVARAVGAAARAALAAAPAPAGPLPQRAGAAGWNAAPPPTAAAASGRALLASARVAGAVAPHDEARGVATLPLGERLPALRPLGQVDEAFLVAEAPDGLYLVDQHAAHERVLYERAQAQLAAREPASQPLLQALVAPLSAAQAALAAVEAETLAALGWVLEETDDAALIVRALPALLGDAEPAAALAALLDRLEAEERLSGPERVAASLACRAAVRAGDRVAEAQQRELLAALEGCAQPQTCPHGRPTLLHLSSEQLRRSFGRSPSPKATL